MQIQQFSMTNDCCWEDSLHLAPFSRQIAFLGINHRMPLLWNASSSKVWGEKAVFTGYRNKQVNRLLYTFNFYSVDIIKSWVLLSLYSQKVSRVFASCFPKRPQPMIPTNRGSLLGASCKSLDDYKQTLTNFRNQAKNGRCIHCVGKCRRSAII